MRIIVVGCGKIGTTVIANLVAEGHDVVAVDRSVESLSAVTEVYDVMGLVGNGADYDTLLEAGIEDCELFVAVTGSDEMNMLSCFVAKKMGAAHTIARIRNPGHSDQSISFMSSQLDLSMSLNPDLLAAQEASMVLRLPSASKVETFSRRNFEMIELVLKEDSSIAGLSLIELRKKYSTNYLIGAVQRGEDVFIPDGSFVLREGDRIGITASHTEVQRLLKMLGLTQKSAKNIMIVGGSRTAYYLAKQLISDGSSVKIVERERDVCESLCELLPEADIIFGDGAQNEVLLEEGLRSMDAFVTLTGMDEENILLSYFASNEGVPKVMSKVNRDEFIYMANKLGIDSIISPRRAVADVVVRYARALQNTIGSGVETLYKLMDGKAEALEFTASNDCKLLNIPIKDLHIKKNTLLAGIIRRRTPKIPSGIDMICPGDKVIVLTAGSRINDLEDIIE